RPCMAWGKGCRWRGRGLAGGWGRGWPFEASPSREKPFSHGFPPSLLSSLPFFLFFSSSHVWVRIVGGLGAGCDLMDVAWVDAVGGGGGLCGGCCGWQQLFGLLHVELVAVILLL